MLEPVLSASEILARRSIAVFTELEPGWAIVETDTLETFLGEDMTDLGTVAHFQLLTYEFGQDGYAFLVPPDQDRKGLDARVSFVVPDVERVEGPSRATKSGMGVLRLVTSR